MDKPVQTNDSASIATGGFHFADFPEAVGGAGLFAPPHSQPTDPDIATTSDLFYQAINRYSLTGVANLLGLHPNTVKRWCDQQKIPSEYTGDLRRVMGQAAPVIDQFFTKPDVAEACYGILCRVASELAVDMTQYTFIEPSAGCGYFYNLLPKNKRIGIDLCPLEKGIIKGDYLLWQPDPSKSQGKYIVIGNPPFGLRGHLALQFINHSAKFADIVAFVLPQLFESDGKGVPSKRVNKDFRLASSTPLDANSFCRANGEDVSVSTVFQVWTKVNKHLLAEANDKTCHSFIKVYSLSDGGTPASTRNKHMIGKCDVYLPSTCFAGMVAYTDFEKLPHRRGYGVLIHKNREEIRNLLLHADWGNIAFASTNGALNLRSSIIQKTVMEGGYYD